MFRRKTILLLLLLFLAIFIITTNYLLITLRTESEVKLVSKITIEDKIYNELNNLPSIYKIESRNNREDIFFNVTTSKETNIEELWKISNSWVTKTRLVDVKHQHFGGILRKLVEAKIIKADIDPRGTQLKLLLTLEGNQLVIFKPKWYNIEKIIEGPVYAGKDRYNSEIIAFYLSLILNKPLCPISVARKISLQTDIIPVATKRLLDTSFINRNNKTCIYGKCFFCNKNDPICDNENSSLIGAVILNFKANLLNHRSPWQRTYKKDKLAPWQEFPDKFCEMVKRKLPKNRLLDLIDVSIFDFLIQNGDRHHYETLNDTVLWLDNGKGFGNPYKNYIDILAPLYQCCMLRKSTYSNLLHLSGGNLIKQLKNIPNITDLITNEHLEAINKRLLIVFATLEYCKNKKK